jgi:anti-anti-sigma factor
MSTADVWAEHTGSSRRPFQTPCVEISEVSATTTVMTLRGEYDLFTKYRLVDALVRTGEVPTLIIDLTPCTFLDSSIISALVGKCYAERSNDRRAMLVMPQDRGPVHRMIELTRLDELLPVHTSMRLALEDAGEHDISRFGR